MPAYILTGAPGAGKTTIIDILRARGHAAVPEAATDVIAASHAQGDDRPWERPDFTHRIALLQRERRLAAPPGLVFHDRSVICTLALARFLGHAVPPALQQEVDTIRRAEPFAQRVFFIANLGFVAPTEARRISFEDSLRFEAVHRETYAELGFELYEIAKESPESRAQAIIDVTSRLT
jgi:predicted ATPase